MKIPNWQAPIEDPNASNDDFQEVDDLELPDDDDSNFAQMLAKKRADGDERETKSRTQQSPPSDRRDVAPPVTQPKENLLNQVAEVNKGEAPRGVEVPKELQQLLHEITVGVNAAGHKEVHIELNSDVLKGLQIQIQRQENGVGIQFISASEAVGAMLTRNMTALVQGLADRGVEVAGIQVSSPGNATRDRAFARGAPGRGGQGQRGRG